MRKAWALLALVVLALGLAACGGSTMKLSKDPQVRKAQQIVQSCLSKTGVITKGQRQAFLSCVAPKGDKAKVETCIQNTLAHGSYLTKGQRLATEEKVVTCVVNR
jgi:hypothetical protein